MMPPGLSGGARCKTSSIRWHNRLAINLLKWLIAISQDYVQGGWNIQESTKFLDAVKS
jgi:hypothetical protein